MKRKLYEEPTFEYIQLAINNELLNGSNSGEIYVPDIGNDVDDDDFFD